MGEERRFIFVVLSSSICDNFCDNFFMWLFSCAKNSSSEAADISNDLKRALTRSASYDNSALSPPVSSKRAPSKMRLPLSISKSSKVITEGILRNRSSDSFVFIYSRYPYWNRNYIKVIPAFRIFNLTLSKISGYALSLSTFFKYFLSCYIGDHKIMQVVKYPENLLEHAKNVLFMKITPTEERWLT